MGDRPNRCSNPIANWLWHRLGGDFRCENAWEEGFDRAWNTAEKYAGPIDYDTDAIGEGYDANPYRQEARRG